MGLLFATDQELKPSKTRSYLFNIIIMAAGKHHLHELMCERDRAFAETLLSKRQTAGVYQLLVGIITIMCLHFCSCLLKTG